MPVANAFLSEAQQHEQIVQRYEDQCRRLEQQIADLQRVVDLRQQEHDLAVALDHVKSQRIQIMEQEMHRMAFELHNEQAQAFLLRENLRALLLPPTPQMH